MKSGWWLACGLVVCLSDFAYADSPHQKVVDEVAQSRITPLLKSKKLVGLVVGITADGEHSVHSFGTTSLDVDSTPPDGQTLFEIGSITKVFTALALASMAEEGKVEPDDPINKLLAKDQKTPNWKGNPITLESLATHRSGLPRLPNAILVRGLFSENPYEKYSSADMLTFLGSYRLKRDVGAEYEYSNLGAGLLGYLLAKKNGTDYETLIREQICKPIGLADTVVTLSRDQQARFAKPYYSGGKPAKNWTFDAFAGAGALRSTANDMLHFLDANLGLRDTPINSALGTCQQKRTESGIPGLSLGLGWHIFTMPKPLIWHNGGTGGYRSFAGFDPEAKLGVVVLGNTDHDVDPIALAILKGLLTQKPAPAGDAAN